VTETVELGLVERRVASAVRLVGDDCAAAARIPSAPAASLLTHDSADVARHAALLSPVPPAGEVRAAITPGPVPGAWHLDVAARDRPGLLVACSGVLAARGIDVVQAVVATWDDGAALEAFVVRSPDPPDAPSLQDALEASLSRPQSSPPVPDADVVFDHEASSVYTACEVRAGDRPGLLHALAVAVAAAGADVHAARVATVAGVAVDRFDLTDGAGGKLDRRLEAAIRTRIRTGVTAPARRRRHWLLGG
jgi:[protein-PII] uridylyltransferase